MGKKLIYTQAILLSIGTVFSWTTLVFDYRRFFTSGGHLLQISGCAVANPVVTPCFYGALAFLASMIWAIIILRSSTESIVARQRNLQYLLAAGVVFAWGNLIYEAYLYMQVQPATSAFSCPSGDEPINPLLTPCFYGALIFLIALIISILIRRSAARR